MVEHGWDAEHRARETYKFIKNVNFANERKWFKPGKELVYIITGYGLIKSSLLRRGLTEDGTCLKCEVEEIVEHLIYDCVLHQNLREGSFSMDRNRMQNLIDNQEMYEWFTLYIKSMFDIRETYLLTTSFVQHTVT